MGGVGEWRGKHREAVLPNIASQIFFMSGVSPIREYWLHFIKRHASFHPRKGPNAGPLRRRRRRTCIARVHDLVNPDAITLAVGGEDVGRGARG